MEGCIRKAVEWCEGLPSYDTTHVQKNGADWNHRCDTEGWGVVLGHWPNGRGRGCVWPKHSMRVHKNTLSLLGYPSRVKRPFSGPPIFFKKESRLLLGKPKWTNYRVQRLRMLFYMSL
jgi:hypothetical protein